MMMDQDYLNLEADLFVSELMMSGLLGGRRIRLFLEQKIIHSLRDLYSISNDAVGQISRTLINEEERQKIKTILTDLKIKDTARRKAETCRRLKIFSVSREDA